MKVTVDFHDGNTREYFDVESLGTDEVILGFMDLYGTGQLPDHHIPVHTIASFKVEYPA